ncbi:MAG: hypothetical protein ACRC2R_24425 [Xenococcaceae cyanobacterium]
MLSVKSLVITLASSLLLYGCIPLAKGTVEGTQSTDEYIALPCKLKTDNTQVSAIDSLKTDIYVDGSGSMLGYVTSDNSTYSQILKILDNVISLGGSHFKSEVKYYRSGDSKNKLKGLTRSQFMKAVQTDFYNGSNPDFPAVSSDLVSLVTASKKDEKLTIIVTDLAQNNGDVTLINQKIKEHYFNNKQKDYAVGVWGIKSEFNGTVYSADRADRNFTYNTQGKNSEQYRPFYVVFVGSYQDIANYFTKLQKESSKFSDRSEFSIFSPKHLLTEASYLKMPTKISHDLARVNALNNGDVAVENNNQPIELLEVLDNNSKAAVAEYQVELHPISNSLAIDPNDLDIKTQVTAFDKFTKKNFKEVPEAQNALHLNNWQIKNDRLSFTTKIEPNNFTESGIYYFAIDLVAKDLRGQSWWNEWDLNAEKDDLGNGSKTENLLNFMNGLKSITVNSMETSALTVGRFCYAVQKN